MNKRGETLASEFEEWAKAEVHVQHYLSKVADGLKKEGIAVETAIV